MEIKLKKEAEIQVIRKVKTMVKSQENDSGYVRICCLILP